MTDLSFYEALKQQVLRSPEYKAAIAHLEAEADLARLEAMMDTVLSEERRPYEQAH